MFVSKRKIKGKDYFYLEDRINGKRTSFFLGSKKQAEKKIENAFDELLGKKTLENAKKSQKEFDLRVLSFSDLLLLERLKINFKTMKNFFPEGFESFNEDEFVRYAQGSTSVEGNSLSLQEANIVLTKGASIAGKKIDEIKEIENMKKAADASKRTKQINEKTIKKIHAAIMDGFKEKNPGEYRKQPIFIQASKVKTAKAEEVENEMRKLLEWHKKEQKKKYCVESCAEFHAMFEQIHPFLDGNGRTGREILNWTLQKESFPRAIINLQNRESYVALLERVQLSKQYFKFTRFIVSCLESRAKEIEEIIKENKKLIIGKLLKKIKT
ncbi:MAG TPA: Fic family protein [archaeon]|nr:Fic family protein [archaeon]